MHERSIVASICVVSAFAVACGNSAATGSGGDELSPLRPSEAQGQGVLSERNTAAFRHAMTLLDRSSAADVKTKHGLVSVERPPGPVHDYAEVLLGGDGLDGSVGKKEGTADGCSLFAQHYGGPNINASAGVVTVTYKGGTVDLSPVGVYPHVFYDSVEIYGVSGSITMSAAGGPDLGAFSGTQPMPRAIDGFTAPSSASRGAGWTAAWTPATSSYMAFYVLGLVRADGGDFRHLVHTLRCQTADSGSFTVSPAALALFPAQVSEVVVDLERTNEIVREVSGYTVSLDTIRTGATTGGIIKLTE